MMRMSTLERAIAIAAEGHAGQLDKAGNPYILHPLRVMLQLDTLEERMAGVLHDVVEDCDWSLDDLRAEGFSPAVVRAVDSVTKREGESYEQFVLRAAADPIGRRVKLADLHDNSDLGRIRNPTSKDLERLEKYQRAIRLTTGQNP
jgi:(p)ppGpp synthase/HD superfamily hydrolase